MKSYKLSHLMRADKFLKENPGTTEEELCRRFEIRRAEARFLKVFHDKTAHALEEFGRKAK